MFPIKQVKGGTTAEVAASIYAFRVTSGALPGLKIIVEDSATLPISSMAVYPAPDGAPWSKLTIDATQIAASVVVFVDFATSAEMGAKMLAAGSPGAPGIVEAITAFGNTLPVKVYGSNNQPLDQDVGTNRLIVYPYGTQGQRLLQDAGQRLVTGSLGTNIFNRKAINLNVAGANEAGNHYLAADGTITVAQSIPIDISQYSAAEFMAIVTTATTGPTTFAWFMELLAGPLAGDSIVETIPMGTANDYRTLGAAGVIALGTNGEVSAASKTQISRRGFYARIRYNLVVALTAGNVTLVFNGYP